MQMILRAKPDDLESIFLLTKSCAQFLETQNIFQWNESYPSKKVLQKDINLEQIYKLVIEKCIIGIVVLTEVEDFEYKTVSWLSENNRNLYIHRLAVHPNYQGCGYAQKLMDFAEDFALNNKYTSIRLDTFSGNKRNQRFYEIRNYRRLESIYFPNQSAEPFYCYEKILNV